MLEVKNVTKRFGSTLAVDNVSFQVGGGRIVGLIGANGAGKTTLLKLIVGLLYPDEGSVAIDGKAFGGRGASPVAYLPDRPIYFEELTVTENLAFMARIWRVAESRVTQLCEDFALSPYADVRPPELSRGNQQKLMLIFSLMREFSILIADEPFAGLDPLQTSELRRHFQKTVIVSIHQLELAQNFCDEYILMHQGRVLFQGNQDELAGWKGLEQGTSLADSFLRAVSEI